METEAAAAILVETLVQSSKPLQDQLLAAIASQLDIGVGATDLAIQAG
jgi:hypothetical protein